MRRALESTLLAFASVLFATACSSLPFTGKNGPSGPEEVPAWIARARAELEAGDSAAAVERLRVAQDVERLSTDVRIELETLLERAADERIRELAGREDGARELEKLVDLGLPGPLAVTAGVTAARKYLDTGRAFKAYQILEKLETSYPTHHERRAAGSIVAAAGLAMAQDSRTFLGFFSRRDEGIEALEWLTINYPSEPRCDEAYFSLAERYAEDRKFQLSVRRFEDLIAYHIASPLAVEAEARIPRMRLVGLESPEYDRRELLRARIELESWLEKHAGHELEDAVRVDYADCVRRLVISDQVIARFYLRIGEAFGARLHARRAVETARLTGDADLVARCEKVLASAETLLAKGDEGSAAGRFLDSPEAEIEAQPQLSKPEITRERSTEEP